MCSGVGPFPAAAEHWQPQSADASDSQWEIQGKLLSVLGKEELCRVDLGEGKIVGNAEQSVWAASNMAGKQAVLTGFYFNNFQRLKTQGAECQKQGDHDNDYLFWQLLITCIFTILLDSFFSEEPWPQ